VDSQTALPREIIVVDDGSDDPIEPIVESWKASFKIPIHLICQPNRGAPAARNVGIKAASSRYIAFLDADDIWLSNKLKTQYEIMQREKLILSGHGYAHQINQLNRVAKDKGQALNPPIKRISFLRFIYGNPFFTPTIMINKDFFSGFDERFRCVDDYKAWVDNFQPNQYGLINEILAAGFKPAIGHSGLTSSVFKMHENYIDVLKMLRKEDKINNLFYYLAIIIEAIKLPARKYITKNNKQ